MNITRLWNIICATSCLLLISNTVHAVNVAYDFSGTCGGDCGPLGVLDTAVGPVTGAMELNLLEPTVAQSWDKDTVLNYSFTFGNFTIDNTNSSLANVSGVGGGNVPFTTAASYPFSIDDGFLRATYTPEPSLDIALTIGRGGINLIQGSLEECTGTCQALALGSWTRTSAVPIPAAVWLFGSGLLGLVGMARRKKAA